MNIDELADRVASREELVTFLRELAMDCEANASSWENGRLEDFLEALAAWTAVADRYYANRGERLADVSPWRQIADALLAARIYE